MLTYPAPMTRRRFLAAGAMAAAAAAIPFAEAEATNCVRVTRVPMAVPGLATALAGATIAQVSDLHLYEGGYEGEPHLAARHALEMLEHERPDLLVLTGDQWDRGSAVSSLATWLGQRPAGLPTLAVLGNHEYSAGATARSATRAHERGGADLLVNRSVTVVLRGAPLQVIGLDDLRHGRPDPDAAARGLDPEVPQLWLMHEPGMIDQIRWPASARPFLTLAGHTHGGQVRCPGVPPLTPTGSGSYVSGLYRTSGGPLYVSRGVGATHPRIRVLCPPELPIFELRPMPTGDVASLSPIQASPSRRRFLTGL